MSGDDRRETVSALIAKFSASLEQDGYRLDWSLDESSSLLNASVVAGPDACEECLIPKQLMLMILESALEGSGIGVGSLLLPAEAHTSD